MNCSRPNVRSFSVSEIYSVFYGSEGVSVTLCCCTASSACGTLTQATTNSLYCTLRSVYVVSFCSSSTVCLQALYGTLTWDQSKTTTKPFT